MSSPSKPPLSATKVWNGTVYVSGQTGADSDGRIPESFAEEMNAAVANLAAALAAAGSSLEQSLKVNVYLTDAANFAEMNNLYRTHFAEPYPARTTAITGLALPGLRFEIDAVAAVS